MRNLWNFDLKVSRRILEETEDDLDDTGNCDGVFLIRIGVKLGFTMEPVHTQNRFAYLQEQEWDWKVQVEETV